MFQSEIYALSLFLGYTEVGCGSYNNIYEKLVLESFK